MRRVSISIFVLVLLITAGFSPFLAAAAPLQSDTSIATLSIDTSNFLAQGLVTCNGPDCNFCTFMAMVNNIIAWLVGIAMVIATIGLAIAGYKMVYSQGNSSAVSYAKSIFFNVIIGIILIIGAWFMVDTLMKLTVGDNFGPWDRIDEENCGMMYEAPSGDDLEREITATEHEIDGLDYGPDGYLGGATGGVGPGGGPIPGAPYGSGDTLMLAGGGSVKVSPCYAPDLSTISFLGHQVTVHKNLTASLVRIDAKWKSLGGNAYYEVRSVGGYNCRKVTNGSSYSNHAYGLAVDINPDTNPYSNANPPVLETDMRNQNPAFYTLFTAEGWGWGANWTSVKDAMHFSKARGEQGDMRGE